MKRKLIEVALPLEAISAASRRDKDRKVGTIKNVHKWFAPMPTPAWRALLFAALVDDPDTPEERLELLQLVRDLCPEDASPPTSRVLQRATQLLASSGTLPTVLDPFCGGGSTLMEARRLGLPAAGSDLNPVPVLVSRTLNQLLPPHVHAKPLHSDARGQIVQVRAPFEGFLSDLRYYAKVVAGAAWAEVGALYRSPSGGGTFIAWFWARTVECPSPACRAQIPLYSTYLDSEVHHLRSLTV